MTTEVRHSGPKRLAFPAEEYDRRRKALLAEAGARGLDLVILDEAEHLAYLAGFGVSASLYRAALIPLEGEPLYLLRALDAVLAAERSWIDRIVGFVDWEDPIEALAGLVREGGWPRGRIGLDFSSSVLTVARHRQLAALLPEADLVDIAGLLPGLQARKSADEQARLRRAAEIADAAMAAVVGGAHDGVTPREMSRLAADVFLAHGRVPDRGCRPAHPRARRIPRNPPEWQAPGSAFRGPGPGRTPRRRRPGRGARARRRRSRSRPGSGPQARRGDALGRADRPGGRRLSPLQSAA